MGDIQKNTDAMGSPSCLKGAALVFAFYLSACTIFTLVWLCGVKIQTLVDYVSHLKDRMKKTEERNGFKHDANYIKDCVINIPKRDVRCTDTGGLVSEAIRNAIGAVYIRWGNKTCPSTAELVYEGVIGGSLHSNGGSGANYQCLPLNPIYDTYVPGNQSRARMYGAKYKTNHFSPLAHVDETNPVCSVCRVKSRSTVLMVPGRNQCPADEWTREYYGYLMSSHHSHKRTEYVCVDRHPESRPNSERNRGGALLYAVESRCDKGTLPCGPYLEGRELTCAVCTM